MRRRIAFILAGCAVLVAAPPAHAEDEIGLSTDGVHWTPSLTEPLFDPEVQWVPGDVRTARFFVRNERPDKGDLTVSIDRVVRDDLLDTGWLAISARAGTQPFTTVTAGGTFELVEQDRLGSGVALPVEVRVAMADSAPNRTMVLGTDLDLTVTLTDSDAVLDESGSDTVVDDVDSTGNGSNDPGSNDTGTGGADGAVNSGVFLPGTGNDVPPWLPPLGLLLLGSGTYLVVRRRHRDEDLHAAACTDLETSPPCA